MSELHTVPLDLAILAGIRRELARLCELHPRRLPDPPRDGGKARAALTDARAGIVTADFPTLLGTDLDPVALKACQRAAERLERAGKIERLRLDYSAVRVTHLQLTEGTE